MPTGPTIPPHLAPTPPAADGTWLVTEDTLIRSAFFGQMDPPPPGKVRIDHRAGNLWIVHAMLGSAVIYEAGPTAGDLTLVNVASIGGQYRFGPGQDVQAWQWNPEAAKGQDNSLPRIIGAANIRVIGLKSEGPGQLAKLTGGRLEWIGGVVLFNGPMGDTTLIDMAGGTLSLQFVADAGTQPNQPRVMVRQDGVDKVLGKPGRVAFSWKSN